MQDISKCDHRIVWYKNVKLGVFPEVSKGVCVLCTAQFEEKGGEVVCVSKQNDAAMPVDDSQ